jgi:DNA-binding transcriptional regulator YiaG
MRKNHDIKKLRGELGLTQQEFAVALGVGLRTVQRWESSICKPSPLALQKLKELIAKPSPS